MISLAVKYRPKVFKDVVGQTAIKCILQYQIDSGCNQNCYLFTGGAGTGKTTCARIFANELNGGEGLPIEIDAASNNGVEQVRKIIEEAKYKSLDSNFKIYILDECHMLSSGAWNALLKLLEEPPAKTIFIMCTTDPQKIPATILSRVQRFDFQRISLDLIVERLVYITEQENIQAEDLALQYIAKLANGGMRDAITLLDKCVSYNRNVSMDSVVLALGVVDYKEFFELLTFVYSKDDSAIIKKIDEIYMAGKDLKQFTRQFYFFIIDLLCYKFTQNLLYTQIPEVYTPNCERVMQAESDDDGFLNNLSQTLKGILTDIKWEQNPKPFIIAGLICNDL